jgi:two-component system, LytTR family, response regulator
MIRSLIIDDEPDGRNALQSQLARYCPQVTVVGMAEGVADAYEKINDLDPELLFLDIKMDDGTAFDLLQKFTQIRFKIIFVTAFDEYAIEAIRYSALDYLLKPVRPTLLIEAVEKMAKSNRIEKLEEQVGILLQQSARREKIALPTTDGLIFVKITDVLRCESDGSYTRFVLHSGKMHMVSRTLKEFEELLPATVFFRAHKSHLINTNYIAQYINRDGGMVVMDNGDQVPLARNRKDDFMLALNR